jgi:hypothetical protein
MRGSRREMGASALQQRRGMHLTPGPIADVTSPTSGELQCCKLRPMLSKPTSPSWCPSWWSISVLITSPVRFSSTLVRFDQGSSFIGMACALRGLQKATTGPISSCVASQAGGTAESLRAGLEYSVGAKIPKILDFLDDGGLTRNMTCAYLGTDEYRDATFTFNAVNGGEQSAVRVLILNRTLKSRAEHQAGGQATGTVNISPRIDGSWVVSPMPIGIYASYAVHQHERTPVQLSQFRLPIGPGCSEVTESIGGCTSDS